MPAGQRAPGGHWGTIGQDQIRIEVGHAVAGRDGHQLDDTTSMAGVREPWRPSELAGTRCAAVGVLAGRHHPRHELGLNPMLGHSVRGPSQAQNGLDTSGRGLDENRAIATRDGDRRGFGEVVQQDRRSASRRLQAQGANESRNRP
jgi:hypothetical protein